MDNNNPPQTPKDDFSSNANAHPPVPDMSTGWYKNADPSQKKNKDESPTPETTLVNRPPSKTQVHPPQRTQIPQQQRSTPAREVPPPQTLPLSAKPTPQPSTHSRPGTKEKLSGLLNQFEIPSQEELSKGFGCLLRLAILGIFVIIFAAAASIAFAFIQYQSIKNSPDFPDVHTLREHAPKFETTYILDRNGDILYEIIDPNAGRRTFVPLQDISPLLIAATIATEDQEYYNHPGFDPIAIGRALIQNYLAHETVSGASTITQQLARSLLLTPEERYTVSYQRKAKEIVLAAELTRLYSKEEILEIYINQANYGNLAYGIQAAAETYFHTTADNLTYGEATFLAGLPQAPAIWNIHDNFEATLNRHTQVLTLTYEMSQKYGCIEVSPYHDQVCVTEDDTNLALLEMADYQFEPPVFEMKYPHWVNYIRSWLFSKYDESVVYQSGLTIHTSLDPEMQNTAEQLVAEQISTMQANEAYNAALVAIDPKTGEILAMVGSPDFYNDEIAGQINMAISPRQPGSSIKPLTYAAAFEKGWTPSTLIWDIPTDFSPSGLPDEYSPPYQPVNYDGRFHGPVTVRSALANSYNIPAVKALEFVHIYDDPDTPETDGFINFAKRLGITTLNRDDYGLSLTLGGGDVTLLEMTKAFATFANLGREVTPIGVLKIVDRQGQIVYEAPQPTSNQVIRPEHAFLIGSILSDNQARAPMFGTNSILNLPFQAAAKTGTTNDFRDNWTLGYTEELAVGVWVGNADYTPMVNTTGLSGAAPIWANFMKYAIPRLTNNAPTQFSRPDGIVEKIICSTSGTEPSSWCANQQTELFAYDQPPQPASEDLWAEVKIDPWSGYISSSECPGARAEIFVLNVKDQKAIDWIRGTNQGRSWATSLGFTEPFTFPPDRECKSDDPRAVVEFAFPTNGQTITAKEVEIYGVIDAEKNFDHWELAYATDSGWKKLAEGDRTYSQPFLLHTWNIDEISNGTVSLRIKAFSTRNTDIDTTIKINLQVPTATPTETPEPSQTPTITTTPTPTSTFTPTPTITPTP